MTILSLSSGDDDNNKYDTSPIKRKQRWIHGLKVDRIINKYLIVETDGVHPLTLTFFHVAVSSLCDCDNVLENPNT